MLRFASLGSGSRGNAHIVSDGENHVMLDCGFGLRECQKRLARLQLSVEQLSAAFVSHEHSDHIAGVNALAEAGLAIYTSQGTQNAAGFDHPNVRTISAGSIVRIQQLQIHAHAVPHDAAEPVQFTVQSPTAAMMLLTDLGHLTPALSDVAQDVDLLVLEFNHDLATLRASERYPAWLKKRIAGNRGHLNNHQSADFIKQFVGNDRLQQIVMAHLSQQNNSEEMALSALSQSLGSQAHGYEIHCIEQANGLPWITTKPRQPGNSTLSSVANDNAELAVAINQ